MLDRIRREIAVDSYYTDNFSNNGQRFVAWYLRRVLLRSPEETRQEVTDGANDKQIDAIVVDDDNRRVLVIQGKFLEGGTIGGEYLREVLAAWAGFRDLDALQRGGNERLQERLEAVRQALDEEYEAHFELLATGELTDAARVDFDRFADGLAESTDFPASLQLVNIPVLETRLTEAEAKDLPILNHVVTLDPSKTMLVDLHGTRSVIAAIPLRECLRLPGINDGRLFRKNVRQSLGPNNRVNRGLRNTIRGERAQDFFFYHNGITALCRKFELSDDKTKLALEDLSVVNGCQSLTTINSTSQHILKLAPDSAHILFRFYEIPQRELADKISINTNSQSAVKPRDLRSNDRTMLSLKRAYEAMYPDGFFINQRGMARPADRKEDKTVDCAELAKAIMSWHCQRPNVASNEKRLFDEYYNKLFRSDYDPVSIYALHTWLRAIEKNWNNLSLNAALKAGKSYVRFHMLYAVSALVASASDQPDKVPIPSATLPIAEGRAMDVLPLAVNCLNQALKQAIQDAQLANKVFSPQNWSKSGASVQGEAFVAGMYIGALPGIGGQATVDKLTLLPHQFGLRWVAD